MLASVFVILAVGIHLLSEWSIQSLIKANAQSASELLAKQIINNVPDIDEVLKGKKPSEASLNYLRALSMSGSIHNFIIYDSKGHVVRHSDHLADDNYKGEQLDQHHPEVLDAVKSGNTYIHFENEVEDRDNSAIEESQNVEDSKEEPLIAETYVPVIRNSALIGIVSAYVDQTELAGKLRSQLRKITALIATLFAFGFAIPTIEVFRSTRQKQLADQKVAYLAQFDVLTNLQNRKTFESSLSELLLDSGHSRKRVALHFIDLDFFKAINDNYGHAFGDELLKEFAKRLKENLKPGDIAARFGGDEFVVAQTGLDDIEALAVSTKQLYSQMVLPLQIMGKTLVPSVSMGTAMYPDNGIDTSILLHCADIALYVVKGQGRNGHRFFEPSHNQARLRRTDLEFLVRKNVVSRNFELNYQPYIDLTDGTLTGFEALLRMKDTHGKYVSPVEFIPVAEDLGLINEIGAWVLLEACKFATAWPKDIKLSVNLSSVQFRKKTACPSVLHALTESGLNPSQLVVEITESVLLSDVDEVRQQIQLLKSYGVELAMDDFGTGYSSLSYILRLPLDRLKIDRSFITQMSTGDKNALKLVDTIISLGHTMKMSVTAEGVETQDQADTLRAMGCDHAQGYLYSKPVDAANVSNILMKNFIQSSAPDQHMEVATDPTQNSEQPQVLQA